MEPRISTLLIERFRALRHLEIEGLGRVNLITGRNNTGKSSVLEALLLLMGEGNLAILAEILDFREEGVDEEDSISGPIDIEAPFPWSSLFSGFPRFSEGLSPISVQAKGRGTILNVSLHPSRYSYEELANGMRKAVPLQSGKFDEEEALPGLTVAAGGSSKMLTMEGYRRVRRQASHRSNPLHLILADQSGVPCVSVSPFGGERTATLGALWDSVVLSDREQDVVEALRIIDPNILAVSMVGGEGRRSSRRAIVRSKMLSRPVPLRSFGDGLNRLFGIALSLVNAEGGLLLIDEFENGMHHSIQTDVWRAIFTLAKRLDVQVVATSHSWDAIEAFQEAARESPEEGVLVRLTRKGDDIIPTVFREPELAVATREGIEVR